MILLVFCFTTKGLYIWYKLQSNFILTVSIVNYECLLVVLLSPNESDIILFLKNVNNNKEFENKNHMRGIFENIKKILNSI